MSDGRTTLLVELGLAFKAVRRALGFTTSALAGALISHGHGDHARGVKDALRAGIDCYMSAGTAAELGLAGHHRVHRLEADRTTTIGTLRVAPFEAIHDAAEPLSFLIQDETGDRLLYVTDSAYVPARADRLGVVAIEANYSVELLAAGVERGDYPRAHKTRVMSTHMSIERVLSMLRANDLSALREVHLLHLSDGNSDAAGFRSRVQRATGVPTFVAGYQEEDA